MAILLWRSALRNARKRKIWRSSKATSANKTTRMWQSLGEGAWGAHVSTLGGAHVSTSADRCLFIRMEGGWGAFHCSREYERRFWTTVDNVDACWIHLSLMRFTVDSLSFIFFFNVFDILRSV